MADPRTLFVTGASSGIGAAVVRQAARPGLTVLVHFSGNLSGAEAVAAEARDRGATAHLLQTDLAYPDRVAPMIAEAAAMTDPALPLDFVNNAGVVDSKGTITDMTPERLTRMFNVNVISAILAARGAVGLMRRRGAGGGIVNISSVAARIGSGNQYLDYAASKGAIDTFTLGLADELVAEGIRVNGVRPGIIDTGIHGKGGEPDRAARFAPNLPMGRAGTADEVAQAVLWLLSDAASYTTRTILDVAGGR
ncbi:sugar dehydrogenase [Oceanicola sp. 22II-s10i]|uniref:SDR family oxidoreductase n=1 Tax=Oceanicola sp. 22II-s10i TaxID=1317116 RepID=UPI000B521F01|nr:SDR family oxidoreductase [Oceanicola sp. 22II-s10i]OWU84811.1 sugar dehydrogenase [Oceanicola sp. 22II-s10i]